MTIQALRYAWTHGRVRIVYLAAVLAAYVPLVYWWRH